VPYHETRDQIQSVTRKLDSVEKGTAALGDFTDEYRLAPRPNENEPYCTGEDTAQWRRISGVNLSPFQQAFSTDNPKASLHLLILLVANPKDFSSRC
jgi:hypothetical protein